MARTTIVQLTDDLDGGKADQTVTFALNGTTYEIDLSKRNANALEKALSAYVANARKVSGRRSTAKRSPSSNKERLSHIREWAASQGIEVAERGRISASVVEAYDQAN
jgi:hypothetical protein